jgi:hypothetical protein
MLLGQAPGQLAQGKGLAGKGAKGGAEGGADKRRGEPFAGNVGYDHEMGSVRFSHYVEVVSADLIASSGSCRYGVTGDRWHGLGQQALLDSAGGIEVLSETGVIEVPLVVDGILDRDGGLQDKTFQEIAFVEA